MTKSKVKAKVSMGPLKESVKKMPEDSPLRMLILSQPDELDSAEYLIKLKDWAKLMSWPGAT